MIRILLRPQRPTATVGDAVHALTEPGETVAVISAGWQEAEGDIQELDDAINRPLLDLTLYARTDSVLDADATLRDTGHKCPRYYHVKGWIPDCPV